MISRSGYVRMACVAAIIASFVSTSACAAYDEPTWGEVRQEFVETGRTLGYEDPQSTDVPEQVHMSLNGCALYLTREHGETKVASVENTRTKEGLNLNYPLTEEDRTAMKRIGC